MKQFIMAIDQGTTGTTVLIIDIKGEIVGKGYQEIKQYYPQPGWVEHDPDEIFESVINSAKIAMNNANIGPKNIKAIGITNQRETAVLWDKQTGKPLHKAIVWQCRRTEPLCEKLRQGGYGEKIQAKTGLVVDPYFSGTKIAWLLENNESIKEAALKEKLSFGTIDTWLLYKLTNKKFFATDFTNASRTMIFNIHDKKWDKELLELLNIPEHILPEVKPSSGFFGITDPEIFFGQSVPIAGIAGDQQSAMYGQGSWDTGTGKNTYGTGSFLLINTGQNAIISKNGLLTTIACNAYGQPVYALEGAIFITGAAIQWLRDDLQIIDHAKETEAIAEDIPDTKGVYFVPAFVGLGAPYWNSNARAAITGLTRGSGKSEIIRAALESIAYQTRDVADVMNKDSGVELKKLNVDGGASQNNFLMQFQADIFNVPVDRPKNTETTSIGAAYLAGLATKFWASPKELANIRVTEKLFTPDMDQDNRDKLYQGWKEAVKRVVL